MRLLGKMIVSLLFLAVKGDGQRYYCQNNAGADHATPSPSLPTTSCKEGTQRAADKVSGHEIVFTRLEADGQMSKILVWLLSWIHCMPMSIRMTPVMIPA